MAKETFKFLRHIDYAHLQDFDLKILMGYEISPTCFYLTKGGLIRKPNKSELITELKSVIKNIPTHFRPTNHHRNVIIDFMAYATKVLIKKQNLKTYNDFFTSHAIGWILFLMCTKNTASKHLSEDKEQQVKA